MNIQLRTGVAADATAIHDLIAANLSVGHLLPRTFEDIESHAGRFVVADLNAASALSRALRSEGFS